MPSKLHLDAKNVLFTCTLLSVSRVEGLRMEQFSHKRRGLRHAYMSYDCRDRGTYALNSGL